MKPSKILFAVAMATVSSLAFAADEAGAVRGVIRSLFDVGNGMAAASPFAEDGKWLMHVLLLIAFAWAGITGMLSEGGVSEMMSRAFRIIMLYGIVSFFLTPSVQREFINGFDYLSAKAVKSAGGSVDMSDPAKAVLAVTSAGMNAAVKLWQRPDVEPAGATADEQTTWDKVTSVFRQATSASPVAVLATVILEFGARAAISLLLVVAVALYAVVVAMSQVLINIGLILAPILAPWLLLEATEFLFQSWIRFMVTAGMYKVVGALLFAFTTKMADVINLVAARAGSSPSFDHFAYFLAVGVAVMMCYLILQIPSIASGLVSGLPSVSIHLPRLGGGSKSGGSASQPSPKK